MLFWSTCSFVYVGDVPSFYSFAVIRKYQWSCVMFRMLENVVSVSPIVTTSNLPSTPFLCREVLDHIRKYIHTYIRFGWGKIVCNLCCFILYFHCHIQLFNNTVRSEKFGVIRQPENKQKGWNRFMWTTGVFFCLHPRNWVNFSVFTDGRKKCRYWTEMKTHFIFNQHLSHGRIRHFGFLVWRCLSHAHYEINSENNYIELNRTYIIHLRTNWLVLSSYRGTFLAFSEVDMTSISET